MPRVIERTVYKFDELSAEAKKKALDNYRYREGYLSWDWWDSAYEYIAEAADALGIDLRTRKVKRSKGVEINDAINISFSGFSSQGDGACFNGTYAYNPGATKLVKKQFPREHTLHLIADDLTKTQKRASYGLRATVKPGHLSNHYSHYNTRAIEVYHATGREIDEVLERLIDESLRDFMKWMYVKLEEEYNDMMSDEVVMDTIEANNQEFNLDGTLA